MDKNRFEVENKVGEYIAKLEERKMRGYSAKLRIEDVCDELSIFDWWNETLSLTQLKQMKKFLEVAGKLGYNGYVCFKVGAAYCAHGMWAYKKESTTGYSPDGEVLYHSFRNGDNYYDCELPNGKWMHDEEDKYGFTLKEVKDRLAQF